MFKTAELSRHDAVNITLNGQPIRAGAHMTVWAVMALAGDTTARLASVSGAPRSAYCGMGACFECLVEIDGVPNQQACLTKLSDGMTIRTQVVTEHSSVDEILDIENEFVGS